MTEPSPALWRAVLAAARLALDPPERAAAFAPGADAAAAAPSLQRVALADALLCWEPSNGWHPGPAATAADRPCLDLYLPLCQPLGARSRVLGHLGQSLDGCIATASGDSRFVTGPENIRHLHRLRALADAVIVGAGTVARDDPQLTTRLVAGANPVRVVLDPRRRLGGHYRLFHDREAETLLCCLVGAQPGPGHFGQAELVALPGQAGRIDPPALVDALARRGLRRLFVEGGGVTVSGFLQAGCLQRLHIAVAPLIIGQGRVGLCLDPSMRLDDAWRPAARTYRMGGDVLFDLDTAASARPRPAGGA